MFKYLIRDHTELHLYECIAFKMGIIFKTMDTNNIWLGCVQTTRRNPLLYCWPKKKKKRSQFFLMYPWFDTFWKEKPNRSDLRSRLSCQSYNSVPTGRTKIVLLWKVLMNTEVSTFVTTTHKFPDSPLTVLSCHLGYKFQQRFSRMTGRGKLENVFIFFPCTQTHDNKVCKPCLI